MHYSFFSICSILGYKIAYTRDSHQVGYLYAFPMNSITTLAGDGIFYNHIESRHYELDKE